jgi:hypothetical protein
MPLLETLLQNSIIAAKLNRHFNITEKIEINKDIV